MRPFLDIDDGEEEEESPEVVGECGAEGSAVEAHV